MVVGGSGRKMCDAVHCSVYLSDQATAACLSLGLRTPVVSPLTHACNLIAYNTVQESEGGIYHPCSPEN